MRFQLLTFKIVFPVGEVDGTCRPTAKGAEVPAVTQCAQIYGYLKENAAVGRVAATEMLPRADSVAKEGP